MPPPIAEILELIVQIPRRLARNARKVNLIGRAPHRRSRSRAVASGAGLHALGVVAGQGLRVSKR